MYEYYYVMRLVAMQLEKLTAIIHSDDSMIA